MQKYANLVELEKCCPTHSFLQNFVLIQPRTSPLKIFKIFQNLQILLIEPSNLGRSDVEYSLPAEVGAIAGVRQRVQERLHRAREAELGRQADERIPARRPRVHVCLGCK